MGQDSQEKGLSFSLFSSFPRTDGLRHIHPIQRVVVWWKENNLSSLAYYSFYTTYMLSAFSSLFGKPLLPLPLSRDYTSSLGSLVWQGN